MIPVGTRIGSYETLGLIAAGGMGEVYRVRDTRLNRQVAIKFISAGVADADARRRFQQEAQTASALNHPHILTVFEAGEWDRLAGEDRMTGRRVELRPHDGGVEPLRVGMVEISLTLPCRRRRSRVCRR